MDTPSVRRSLIALEDLSDTLRMSAENRDPGTALVMNRCADLLQERHDTLLKVLIRRAPAGSESLSADRSVGGRLWD